MTRYSVTDPGGRMTGAIGVTGRTTAIAARGLRGGLLRSSQALAGELAAPHP
jgi:hypothetical protein